MIIEYYLIFNFFISGFIIILILMLIAGFFVFQQNNVEKSSSYECGFNPIGDARVKFEISYYLTGILFVIFDIEVVYLFPWVLILEYINSFGIYSMLVFMFFLGYGFIYEWINKALEWK